MSGSTNTGQLLKAYKIIARLYAVAAAVMLCVTIGFCLASLQLAQPGPCSAGAERADVYGTLPTDALAFFHRHRMAISVGPRP